MVKREIPYSWESVDQIKYIGVYLKRLLNNDGIYTVEDLLDKLEDFGDEWEDPVVVRNRVKMWLEDLVVNARPNQCVFPQSKFVEGSERSYKTRHFNEKGFNGLVTVMRYYAEPPYRSWVPRAKTGRLLHNKYPSGCRM